MDDARQQDVLTLLSTRLDRARRLCLEVCTRCGLCAEACHAYASTGEVRYTPVARARTIGRLQERHLTLRGRLIPWLEETAPLDDAMLARVQETAFSCTGCRRCISFCPFGVDTQQIQLLAKQMLLAAGQEPKVLSMLADMSVAKGESWRDTRTSFEEAIRRLEAEVLARWQTEAGGEAIPMGVEGADVLYVALAGKHSIVPAAAILNAAGVNWSLSYFEAVNFGAFVGDPERTTRIAARIDQEARSLGVRQVVICECGAAYRVMRHQTGDHPYQVLTLIELVDEYLTRGRLRLRKGFLDDIVTYHDPCQIARNGGVFEPPRRVLRHISQRLVEMEPAREHNWCCGGGGGLVAMGEKEFRMRSARVKADQILATGARTLCTACENCHTQLRELSAHYGLDTEVVFFSAVVADALVRS